MAVALDTNALTPVIGGTYEHPERGPMKVLRSVGCEWHIAWQNHPHEQANMKRWRRLVREGMRKV